MAHASNYHTDVTNLTLELKRRQKPWAYVTSTKVAMLIWNLMDLASCGLNALTPFKSVKYVT